jgi:hypothetical protein
MVVATAPAPAAAQAPGARATLDWRRSPGAEGCIDGADLEELVEAQLGRSVFGEGGELVVEAHIEPVASPRGWRVTIDAKRPDGELLGTREFSRVAGDCRELDRAVALVIALTIDPNASLAPATSSPAPLPVPVVPRSRPRAAAVTAPAPAPQAAGWRVGGSLGTLATVGLLPAPSVALAATLVLDPPRLPAIEIDASTWLERDEVSGAGGAHVDLDAAGVAMCPAIVVRPLVLGGCGGLQLGRMRADGFGFARNQARSETVIQVRLGLRVEQPLLRPLSLRLSLGAAIPLIRPSFYVDEGLDRREVFQPAPVAGVAGVDLFVQF